MKSLGCAFLVLSLVLSACTNNSDTENPDIQKHYQYSLSCERYDNLEQIDQLLAVSLSQYKPHEILVVFDFNYTLMYPLDPCLHINNIDQHEQIFKKALKKLSHSDADKLLCGLMANQNQRLINGDLPAFLKKYDGVNFLVCSSSLKSSIDAYLNLLRKNGVTIKNNYNLSIFEFDEFSEYLSAHPIYKNGVIVTNRVDKGKILKSFFNRIRLKPKLIIFVDNNLKKIESVKNAANELLNTKLIAVEYSEYKTKNVFQVSETEFKNYWENKVKSFQIVK